MNYEVESRGLFHTRQDYTALLEFLQANAEFKKDMHRFQMVYVENSDFSPDPDADVDLRVRIQNGKCLVVVKHGNWHSGATRKEYEVAIQEEDLEEQLNIFHLLGKGWGISLYTETKFFDYQNAEFALVHLHDDIYYWEIEKSTTSKSNIAVLEKDISKLAAEMHLEVMTSMEMQDYVARLTERPFWRFHFENEPIKDWLKNHKKYIDLALKA